jgi:hypothetical protein
MLAPSQAPVRWRRWRPLRSARARLALALAVCCGALAACGDTLQTQPIPHNTLETMLAAPFPVYWLGGSFRGLAITEAMHDPGGAFTVQYGRCAVGGQGTCVPPLRVVTSPDNSFLPLGATARQRVALRGVAAVLASGGRTIEIPTAGVIVSIYALRPALARAAAMTAVPINASGAPGGSLPAPVRDTGFAETPLPSQLPSPLRPLR